MWKLVVALFFLAVVGCGKNDGVRPTGYYGPNGPIAPAPNGQYPGNYGPSFQPQMPQGYPQQYTPFLPVDNYFRQNQQMQAYWQQMWMNWQQYASVRNYNPYNFAPFWYEYCPQVWSGTPMMQVYDYYNTNFYFWANAGTQFPTQVNPVTYWSPYAGYSQYSSCNGYCNW